jgi:hypothetical protein
MPKKTSDLSSDFEKATANVLAIAKKELQAAAKVHRVKIETAQVVYASFANMTIASAPIAGIEKYKDADFEAGAPVQMLIVKSTTRGDIPSGSYVVKAQHRPRATSGTAIFADRTGTAVIQRKLIIRTWKQSAVLFPEIYSDPGTQNLPTINSWHIFPNPKGVLVLRFDAAGWFPHRVIYY